MRNMTIPQDFGMIRKFALVAAQLCYTSFGKRNRFTLHTGTIRARQHQDDRNLYPRQYQKFTKHQKSV